MCIRDSHRSWRTSHILGGFILRRTLYPSEMETESHHGYGRMRGNRRYPLFYTIERRDLNESENSQNTSAVEAGR